MLRKERLTDEDIQLLFGFWQEIKQLLAREPAMAPGFIAVKQLSVGECLRAYQSWYCTDLACRSLNNDFDVVTFPLCTNRLTVMPNYDEKAGQYESAVIVGCELTSEGQAAGQPYEKVVEQKVRLRPDGSLAEGSYHILGSNVSRNAFSVFCRAFGFNDNGFVSKNYARWSKDSPRQDSFALSMYHKFDDGPGGRQDAERLKALEAAANG